MIWWAWVFLGVVLLGTELLLIDAQFYLVFLGVAALLVALGVGAGIDIAPGLQWVAFAVLAVVLLLVARERIYRLLRGVHADMKIGPAGNHLHMPVDLPVGGSCQVEYGGSFWTATNEGEQPIIAGSQARIVRVHGLTLVVTAAL
jgi:membrane protein implicated in regulation of membrane protease activity